MDTRERSSAEYLRGPWEDLSAGIVTLEEAVGLVLENDLARVQRERVVRARASRG